MGSYLDKLQAGTFATQGKTVSKRDLSPLPADSSVAPGEDRKTKFGEPIPQGLMSPDLIFDVIGTSLPAHGAAVTGQELTFLKPVYAGDFVTAIVTVKDKDVSARTVTLDVVINNDECDPVVSGTVTAVLPEGV